MAILVPSNAMQAQTADTAIVYDLRTDKDIYEFGEQVTLIHSLKIRDRAVTVYKFLNPALVLLSKVYGAMDVPAPAAESRKSNVTEEFVLGSGRQREIRNTLQGFGRAFPATDIRYLEPTVYRISVRFYFRIKGDLSKTYVCGDSLYFTVRRNDFVETSLFRYYALKDSCARGAWRASSGRSQSDVFHSCWELLVDSCMHARETMLSPLLQAVLLHDVLREGIGSSEGGSRVADMRSRTIRQYRERNGKSAEPEYLRNLIEKHGR